MRSREADALQAVDIIDASEQICKAQFAGRELAVRVYVLPEEHDFDNVLGDQSFDLRNDFRTRTADLAAAHMRHDAKAANFIAALHDRYERFCALHQTSAIGVFHIPRIAIKSGF